MSSLAASVSLWTGTNRSLDKEEKQIFKEIFNLKFKSMNAEELFHSWKTAELAKYPPNKKIREQAINQMSRKIKALETSLPKASLSPTKRDSKIITPEEQLVMQLMSLIKRLVDG